MGIIANIIISAVVSVLGSWGVYNYAPLSFLEHQQPVKYGSTVTTIQGSDTISGSRATINTNFANLNASKAEISDVSGTTTLSSLASIGTITTGTWHGSIVFPAWGGTGSSTLSAHQVILGNGTGAVNVVNGLGTSGQSLASNGPGADPTWQSISFDQSLPYTNTGLWTFNTAGIIDNASSTFTSTVNLNGNVYLNGVIATHEFGGNGSDGALTISSGTTTISAGNATYIEKNYTSISITGTGHLAFSNPNTNGTFIALRSQGNVTLTCSPAPCIDVSGDGGAGGAGGGSGVAAGSNAANTNAFYLFAVTGGTGAGTGGSGASPAALSTAIIPTSWASSTIMKYGGQFWVGSGGGGGGTLNSSNNATQGVGGRGGGGLLLEVAGAFNFTTAGGIYAIGLIGNNPTNTTFGGPGGGGAGGLVKVLYNTLTANTGTINVSGGAGGTGGSTGGDGGAGGNTAYTQGGTGGTHNNAVGGAGANGTATVEQNTNFF